MSGIKTGTPGFVNPVDGKVYTVDPSDIGSESINPISDSVDPGDMSVDNTIKDVSKKTKVTLGTYLSEYTKGKVGSSLGVSNKYSIDPSSENTQEFSVSNEKGYPQQIAPSQNSQKFADSLPNYLSENYPKVKESFKKGKSSESLPDGNDLIKNIDPNSPSPVKDYVKDVVSSNEFKSSDSFVAQEVDITNPSPDFQPKINDVKDLGKYKGQQGDLVEKDPITLDELRSKASEVTEKNEFPIDASNESLASITDKATGFPSQFNVTSYNEFSFVDRQKINPSSNDASIKSEVFNKGKGPAPFDGHNLLSTIEGNLGISDPSAKYQKYNSGEIDHRGNSVQNDSFGISNGSAGVLQDNPLSEYEGGRGSTLQSIASRGRWAPGLNTDRYFNKPLKLANGVEANQLKMAQVGHMLTLRAAGEIPAITGDSVNPTGSESEAGAIIPSILQLGGKVNTTLFSAKDAFESLSNDEFDPAALSSIAPYDGQSWGNLTSPAEPFDDPSSSIGLPLTLIALITAITTLFSIFGLTGDSKSIPQKKGPISGKFLLGKSQWDDPEYSSSTKFFADAFGIKRVKNTLKENSYLRSSQVGMLLFFFGSDPVEQTIQKFINLNLQSMSIGSIRTSEVVKELAAQLALNVGLTSANFAAGASTSLGSNLVVCRTIIRSGILIAQQIENIVRKFHLSVLGGITSSIGLMKIVSNSKLLLGFNTFVSIGDPVIQRIEAMFLALEDNNIKNKSLHVPVPLVLEDGKTTKTVILSDFLPANLMKHSTVVKNRLSYGDGVENKQDLTLGWSSQRAPSLYLVPKSINVIQSLDTSGRLGSFKGGRTLTQPDNDSPFNRSKSYHSLTSISKSRISKTDREAIEKLLDAEYVPFYFHDVRTNEVVSFHAFLTSLDDGYTATYESVDGFGRVEPVKIYKNTVRRIGMSFIVASTSQDDFDHMWFKINKLLTMVYPQYTAGRELLGENYQFKAPFSQMIGSTPLIRIRLGDLFRSNYSRFGLSRLFGSADGTSYLPPGKDVVEENANPSYLSFGLSDEEFNKQNKNFGIVDEASTERLYLAINEEEYKKFLSKKARLKLNSSTTEEYTIYDVVSTATAASIDIDNPFQLNIINNNNSNDYKTVNKDEIEILNENQVLNTQSASEYNALNNFLTPEKNAIVRSFESAGGKGLAGVIETLNFDWYNQTTWGIDLGRTAPKMCKITISFSPIHDISPGIDHLGYNRAPVYPVGAASAPSKSPEEPARTSPPTQTVKPRP